MHLIAEWLRRVRYLLHRRRLRAVLQEEMHAHRELVGSPARFGNPQRHLEEAHDVWGWAWLERGLLDLRLSVRMLRRSPGFALVAAASLTLGFTLVAGTLAVTNAYLIQSLPFGGADRLYHVMYAPPGPWEPRGMTALDWASVSDVVEFPVTSAGDTMYLEDGAYREAARALRVSHGFVQGLEIGAAVGRVLAPADFTSESDAVVMLGHALWRGRYASDPSIVGRMISVEPESRPGERETLRVVGVLPPAFYFGRTSRDRVDLLLPAKTATRTYMVRLRPRVPPQLAERRITEAARRVGVGLPGDWTGVHLESAKDRYVAGLRPVLLGVNAASIMVLLLVCTNMAVLTLLRVLRREKEMAVRTALGAGRWPVGRLLVFEAMLICGAALAAGISLASVGLAALAPVLEARLGRPAPGGSAALTIDGVVLLGVGSAAAIVACSMALLPLLAPWHRRIGDILRRARSGATDTRLTARLRAALLTLEVAGALVLLLGAGLMLRSVVNMTRTDLGYDQEQLVRARIVLRGADYVDAPAFFQFFERFADRLSAEISSPVVFTDWPPFALLPERQVEPDGGRGNALAAGALGVGTGYFATVGIELRSGRDLQAHDLKGGPAVAVVSETLARRLWPGESPIGRLVRDVRPTPDGPSAGPWRTVVGVAADVRQEYFDADLADIYLPLSPDEADRFGSFYVRTSRTPAALMPVLRQVAAALDPQAVVDEPRLVAGDNQQLESARFMTRSMAVVAGATMLLALLGIYGVTAYAVQQREREIAIRLALGASPRAVRGLFLRDSALVVVAGVALGLAGGLPLGRLLESWLYGVPAYDVVTVVATATPLVVSASLSAWWAARRVSLGHSLAAIKDQT